MKIVIQKLSMFLILGSFTNCTTVYYNFWEKLGKEKRELLKDNIVKAKAEQREVGEEFQDALANFKKVYGLRGSALEKAYDRVKSDNDDAKEQAARLKERIEKVETIGEDLFTEWAKEIKQMESKEYQQQSREKLDATRKKFAPMLAGLKKSEEATQPLLRKLNDQVLFLKHNLNSQAIGSLKIEIGKIEKDITALQVEINKSIEESNKFINQLDQE